MTFLIDNQLPMALARHLRSRGWDCRHVLDVGLGQTDDAEIWRYASREGMTLVTKDDDFVHLAMYAGAQSQVVWVRLGNCRNQALCAAFDNSFERVVEMLRAGERIVELRSA